MPPRLMHKKSRAGCKNCKSRKVKCDEARPRCGACKRHRLECIYQVPNPAAAPGPLPDPTPSVVASHASLASFLSPPVSAYSPVPDTLNTNVTLPERDDGSLAECKERRLLELRLMHRYMQSFTQIFVGSHNSALVEIWSETVPTMAMSHPFLLHAMFAVTALYVAVTKEQAQPIDSEASPSAHELGLEEVIRAKGQYLHLAISGQRNAISNLSKENADAACIAIILISNPGFLLHPMPDADETTYAPPMQWMLLTRSLDPVYQACKDMLTPDSAIECVIKNGKSLIEEGESANENSNFFAVLIEYQPNTEVADQEVYKSVLLMLEAIRHGCKACEPYTLLSRRFISFPHRIPRSFVSLVQQQRPRALVILACFFAMTKAVEAVWWFRGAAEKHVKGLKTLVSPDWEWAFDWTDDLAFTEDMNRRRRLLNKTGMIIP